MLKNRSIISISDLDGEDINEVFSRADKMLENIESGKKINVMSSKILATLFYEPSTRTRLSFESAMERLGGSVISMADSKTSSTSKGETLADTIRIVESYSDLIVIRHPLEGAAFLASRFSSKPIINAGDGSGEHPTQTLIDLYTIRKEFGSIDGKTITIIGDLKYGRTVHSLLSALSRYNVTVNLVSPENLAIPKHVYNDVKGRLNMNISTDITKYLGETDILYVTRIQKERFTDKNEYARLIGSYKITVSDVNKLKKGAIIMHPLPRVDEISSEVDNTPAARYFKQAYYGVPVRMAIISMIAGE
ncbi:MULTISPECIES: aspartate carbamoyltransferase [Ferroplasma]|nr:MULTISPECIES: aspartate carbamoyltransferase [Ferroplasma]MCL4349136.1 aspartate carbamoyltransferase [Candidatus Thermoplasmatota archaeon]NOL60451.1 aspartate carbamoyltransferase [Ferroplasma acidiphilum]